MSLTTRIRFTEPIDPRAVWDRVTSMIDTPADYTWSNVPIGGNFIAWLNPLIYAAPHQGAAVWAYVMYGQDGCKLVEDDDSENYPPAFVELTLISDWSSSAVHDEIVDDMAVWGNDLMGFKCLETGLWVRDDLKEWQMVS